MSFAAAAIATSIAAFVLGLGWLFAGNLLFKRWQIAGSPTGLLVGRRLGAVYLGMGIILAVGSSAPPSPLRTALAAGVCFTLAALATLGVFELEAGRAGRGILVSVVLEIVLAAGFASVLLAG